MIFVLAMPAVAGDLQFAPDRPGAGDSTVTTGKGHVTVELGLAAALASGSTTLSTGGLIGRFGIDDGLELRVRLPDPFVADGTFGVGPAGIGAKVGGEVSDRWSSSVVAELAVDPDDGAVGGMLEGNVAAAFDRVGVWFTGNASGTDAVAVFAGGGVGLSFDGGGTYVNAGHTFGGATLVGLGGYLLPDEALQFDAGVDLAVEGGSLTWLPGLGVAFGF